MSGVEVFRTVQALARSGSANGAPVATQEYLLRHALESFLARLARHRGKATSIVTVIAYTGFVTGPPFVGILSGMYGLRAGMLGVAVLTAVLALATPMVLRSAVVR